MAFGKRDEITQIAETVAAIPTNVGNDVKSSPVVTDRPEEGKIDRQSAGEMPPTTSSVFFKP